MGKQIEQIFTRESQEPTLREELKDFLVQDGLVQKGKNGEIIVDTESLEFLQQAYVNKNIGYEIKQRPGSRTSKVKKPWMKELLLMFEDKNVTALDESKEASLFYQPTSAKEAFDPKVIEEQKFYLFPEELEASKQEKHQYIKEYYQEKGVSFYAASLAAKIFHPSVGGGYRDQETGKLMVYSDKQEAYIPISAEWVRKESGTPMAYENGKKLWDSPTKALEHPLYKELVDHDLLSKDDFKKRKKRVTREELTSEYKHPTAKGLVMLENVRYNLGTQFKNAKVKKLDYAHFGIYNDQNELTHFFKKISQAEIDTYRRKSENAGKKKLSASFIVKRSDITIQKASEYNPESQESPDDTTLFRRQSTIGPTGQVYLQGIYYKLPSSYQSKKVVELADSFYGILNDTDESKIDYWFRPNAKQLDQKQQQQQERRESGEIRDVRIYLTSKRGEIEIHGYREEENNFPLVNESTEQYAQRLSALKHVDEIKTFGDELAEIVGVGMHHIPYREQQWLTTYCLSSPERKQRVFDFAKSFGLEGLHTFMATEYGTGIGDTILDIAENLPKQQSSHLFAKYHQIVSYVEEIDIRLEELYGDEQNEATIRRAVRDVFERAKRLLEKYGKTTSQKDRFSRQELTKLEHELNQVETEVALFAAMYKGIDSKEEMHFEDLSHTNIVISKPEDLEQKEKEEMYELYKRARLPYSSKEFVMKYLKQFETLLESKSEKTDIFRLVHKGKLIAYCRIDSNNHGEKYLGSVNITPDANAADIGMSFVADVVDQFKEEMGIHFIMIPSQLDGYINRAGFNLTGIEKDPTSGYYIFEGKKNKFDSKQPLDHKERRFDVVNNQDEAFSELDTLFQEGYIVSSVKRNPENKSEITFSLHLKNVEHEDLLISAK